MVNKRCELGHIQDPEDFPKIWIDPPGLQYGLELVLLMSDRRLVHGASIKPFDDDSGLNDEEQISLWPAFANAPADSRVTYRQADCA